MPSTHLDLKTLHRLDHQALEELFHIVARSWGRKLSDEEVRRIYADGVRVIVTGAGLYDAAELNYGLFITRISRSLPLRMTLRCIAGNGMTHSAILNHRERHGVVVAGSLVRGTFAGLSSTWIVHESREPGRYTLGQFVNDAVLACYRIPRYAMS
jgi:hypothetical protein